MKRKKLNTRLVKAVARIAFFCTFVLVCVAGGFLGIQAHRPYEKAAQLRAQNDEKMRESAILDHDIQGTRNKIDGLKSPDGVDVAGRPIGWVQPGEHPIHVHK